MQKRIHIQGKSYRIPNSPNFLAIENATKKWSMPLRDWKQAINQFMMLFPDRMPIKFNGGLHRFFYTLITVGGINCENLACNKRAVHLCRYLCPAGEVVISDVLLPVNGLTSVPWKLMLRCLNRYIIDASKPALHQTIYANFQFSLS